MCSRAGIKDFSDGAKIFTNHRHIALNTIFSLLLPTQATKQWQVDIKCKNQIGMDATKVA